MSEQDPNEPMMSDGHLNAALDTSPQLLPSADLMRRVAQIPIEHPRADALAALWPFTSLWRATVSAGFAIVLGVSSGLLSAAPAEADDDMGDLASLTYGTDWDLEEQP